MGSRAYESCKVAPLVEFPWSNRMRVCALRTVIDFGGGGGGGGDVSVVVAVGVVSVSLLSRAR